MSTRIYNSPFELSNESLWVVGFVCLAYFAFILSFGFLFGRFSKNTNDFFFSGQKFPFWVVGASMIATSIGSYSFLKYSQQGYLTGMSSAMSYTNDWFVTPFFLFGWLPIIYLSKVHSVPEYFERRFNRTARYISLVIILFYMFFYIGYNLFTIGLAIQAILKVKLIISLPIVSCILASYVTLGGQTAVIMTDLIQGLILYFIGFLLIGAGLYYVGGLYEWWYWLPESHRLPFVHLTENKSFNTIGLFWGEAIAGSIAFAFLNQGFIMRFLSTRSVEEGRKAAVLNVIVSLPSAAIIVGAVGWIGKSIMMKMGTEFPGALAIEQNTYNVFLIVAWESLKQSSILFGIVVAALLAALMSTIDTLINASAAIGVYDLYKPLIKQNASEKHYLKVAKVLSLLVCFLGFCLAFVFINMKGSLMAIHYKGIMIIIPAIVSTLFVGVFWKSMTSTAAIVAMLLGSSASLLSLAYPSILDPVAAFIGADYEPNGAYIYVRAVFGIAFTVSLCFLVSLFTKPKDEQEIEGLTVWSIAKAYDSYKGAKANFRKGKPQTNLNYLINNKIKDGYVAISKNIAEAMAAEVGDLIFIEDKRWWLAGLRSAHLKVESICPKTNSCIQFNHNEFIRGQFVAQRELRAEKLL